MRFRNSVRLLIENFKNVYKILFYKMAIAVVGIALSCALLLPNLWDILHSIEMEAVFIDIKEFVQALVSGQNEFLAGFQEHFQQTLLGLWKLLDSKMSQIVWSVVGGVLIYLIERILDTLCYFSIGSILDDRMSIYAETPFSAAYIKNLGKASVYSVVYVPIVFLIDLCVIALCYFLFFYLLSFLNVLASLFLSMTLIVVCQALKLTFTSMWLPAMASDNLSVGKAMKMGDKVERKQWKKMFSTYVATVYVVVIVNVVGALCTFGSSLLLTVPASYFLFICQQFVNYYTVKGKKYFITYDKIATNRDRGDSERFFETVEDPEDFAQPSREENGGETAENTVVWNLETAKAMVEELREKVESAETRLQNIPERTETAATQAAEAGESSAKEEAAQERNRTAAGEEESGGENKS